MSDSTPAMNPEDFPDTPSRWKRMLEVAHERRFVDSPEELHKPIGIMMVDSDSHQFLAVCRTGFCMAMLQCVDDQFFCGFSKEYLTSTTLDPTEVSALVSKCTFQTIGYTPKTLIGQQYMCWILKLCAACLSRFVTDRSLSADLPEVQDMLAFCDRRFPLIISGLWDIRDPFLVPNLSYARLSDDITAESGLIEFCRSVDLVYRTFR